MIQQVDGKAGTELRPVSPAVFRPNSAAIQPFMNSRQLNLILVAVNIGLLGTIVLMIYWVKDRPRPLPRPGTERVTVVENTLTQLQVVKFNATNLLKELSKYGVDWAAIESTNYLFYITNLRSIGCPEETIQDIILADVAKLYAKRQAAVLAQAPPFEYWRTLGEDEEDGVDARLQAQLDALRVERDQLVRNLLGVDFEAQMAKYTGEVRVQNRLLAFLAPEKQAQVAALLESFQDLESQVFERSGSVLLPADEAQLRELEQQKQAQLAEILTSEEMKLYQLNLSPLANELRYELHGFDPSPEEFQEVYRLRHTLNQVMDTALQENETLDPEVEEAAIRDAEAAVDAELKKVLGAERFAEYERAMDPDYQFLLKWSDRLQMPEAVASQVYAMKQQAEQQRQRIESNLQLTYEQRQQAYQAIERETKQSLSRLLGPDHLLEYQKSGGQWVDQIGKGDEAFEIIAPELKEVLQPGSP